MKKIKINSLCVVLIAFLAVLVVLKPKITINSNSPKDTPEQQSGIIEKELHTEGFNETNAARSAEEILKDEYYPRYQLLKEVEGKFSPNGSIKRLFLLNDTRQHHGSPKHKINLHKLLAYDENQGKMIEHPFAEEFTDLEYALKRIIPLETKLGPWDGYFYIHDLNQNGVDEIIGFNLGASQFIPEIYEYQDGTFIETLGYWDYSGQFARMEFPARKEIKIFGYGASDEMPESYPWKWYEWSKEEQRYVLIQEGIASELPY